MSKALENMRKALSTFEISGVKTNIPFLQFLRNLRNMQELNIDLSLIKESLLKMKIERILPYRFIAAAKYAKFNGISIDKGDL